MSADSELPYVKAVNRIARLARFRGVGIAFETVDESPSQPPSGETPQPILGSEKRLILEAVEELLALDPAPVLAHYEHPPRLLALHTAAAGRALALLADDLDAVGRAEFADGWRFLATRLLTGSVPPPPAPQEVS